MMKTMAFPRLEENVAITSAQLTKLIEMLKQLKTMLEKHQKLIAYLRTKKDDA